MSGGSPLPRREPRWPVIVAILAVGGLYTALPSSLTVGPKWAQLAVAVALLIPTVIAHSRGNVLLNVVLGHVIGGVLTLFMVWSLVLLVRALPTHKEPPLLLLRSAA